ncbi:uncharacterized protein ARMOST_22179 [Armillaria ostoyae]|uniref:Uncharacterized protein n=1 Tax=Armillaria ostoyae TaxID=47428 RepID=A0A284SC41_ARMOS|nr:uncharacterized protein ARMOST_22179 [Armillaria ostoyae]
MTGYAPPPSAPLLSSNNTIRTAPRPSNAYNRQVRRPKSVTMTQGTMTDRRPWLVRPLDSLRVTNGMRGTNPVHQTLPQGDASFDTSTDDNGAEIRLLVSRRKVHLLMVGFFISARCCFCGPDQQSNQGSPITDANLLWTTLDEGITNIRRRISLVGERGNRKRFGNIMKSYTRISFTVKYTLCFHDAPDIQMAAHVHELSPSFSSASDSSIPLILIP